MGLNCIHSHRRRYLLTASVAALPLLSSAGLIPFMSSGVEMLSWTWIVASSTFTAAVSKVFFRYRMTRSYYHEAVNSHAARNTANTDSGVLSFLIEQAVEEQCKRAVAIYTALLTTGQTDTDTPAQGMSATELRKAVAELLTLERTAWDNAGGDTFSSSPGGSVSRGRAQPWPVQDDEIVTMMDTLAPLGLWKPVSPQRIRGRYERRWQAAAVDDARESIRECWSTLLEGPPAADSSWPWSAAGVQELTTNGNTNGSRPNQGEGTLALPAPPKWGEGIIFGLAPNLPSAEKIAAAKEDGVFSSVGLDWG